MCYPHRSLENNTINFIYSIPYAHQGIHTKHHGLLIAIKPFGYIIPKGIKQSALGTTLYLLDKASDLAHTVCVNEWIVPTATTVAHKL